MLKYSLNMYIKKTELLENNDDSHASFLKFCEVARLLAKQNKPQQHLKIDPCFWSRTLETICNSKDKKYRRLTQACFEM